MDKGRGKKSSASKLKILSANVRGFGDKLKQKKMLIHFESFSPDVICLSDTRFDHSKELMFRNDYGSKYNMYFSNFTSNARGTLIMISKQTPLKVLAQITEQDGNRVTVKTEYSGRLLTVTAVYGPNSDSPNFFTKMFDDVYGLGCEYNLFNGDFNTGPSSVLDYKNYVNVIHKNAREAINDMLTSFDCSDAYRTHHGDREEYTWIADGIRPQMARIDLCLISNNLIPFLMNSEILKSYKSDHNFLINEIDFHNISRGKGFWRIDNELLKDNVYIEKVKSTIKESLSKYVVIDGYDNLLEQGTAEEIDHFKAKSPRELHECSYNINPNLLLEMLINDIRIESIGYSVAVKKAENERIAFISQKLEYFKRTISLNTLSAYDEQQYNDLCTEYDSIIERKALNIMRRDKILSKAFNEKPSKFFCNLEKERSTEKYIPKLKKTKENGIEEIITKQCDIEYEINDFYKNLYCNKDHLLSKTSIHEFLKSSPNDVYPFVNDVQNEKLCSLITEEEMKQTLDSTKNGAAPGQTGLTFEFYKKFWDLLGFFLVKAANYSYEHKKLPDCLSRGSISLLPKEDKDKEILANWRPLTLLSAEYKLIAGCIAKRLGSIMPDLIHPDQNGFVKDRYIGESIRLVYDTMHYAKDNNIKGLLLLVDFEKAFDSVSHSFIRSCLDFFGFKNDAVQWIDILINNFYANTIHAGNVSESFLLGRGTKQGDPISSLLFILCVEILSIKINKSIKGLKIGHIYVKRTLYADDLTIIMEYDENQLRDAINMLKEFYSISGLKINEKKTQAIRIGNIVDGQQTLCNEIKLEWSNTFKLLGIVFDSQLEKMQCNYDKAMEKAEKIMKNWRYRFLTIYGRNVIAKTLLLSKFAHLHLVLPDTIKAKIKEIERRIFNFIWKTKENNDGEDRVARVVSKLPEHKGGMNFPCIMTSIESLKLSWLRRGFSNLDSTWVKVLDVTLGKYKKGLSLIEILCKTSIEDISKIKVSNPFWQSCLKKLLKPHNELLKAHPALILDKVIWGSNLVVITDRVMNRHFNNSISEDIVTIADTLTITEGSLQFKSEDQLTRGADFDIAKLANFRLTIARYLLDYGIRIGNPAENDIIARPRIPLILRLVTLSKKGCQEWSKLIRQSMSCVGVHDQENKWEQKLNCILGVQYWNKCYIFHKWLNYNNKQKWLYYQILRKCLMVNNTVAKFKQHVNVNCTFCNVENETIQHLFYQCTISWNFIAVSLAWLNSAGADINVMDIDIYDFLFIQRSRTRNYSHFVLFQHIKYFLWRSRCAKTLPTLANFKEWLKREFTLLMDCINVYPNLAFISRFIRAWEL